MANATDQNPLESARERLEKALSKLAEEASAAKQALEQSRTAQENTLQELSNQADKMLALEQENHRLHEQIATLSLQQPTDDGEDKATALEAEKNALQQNYDLLKRQYTSLQDEFEGLQDRAANDSGGSVDGNSNDEALRQQVSSLMREREELKAELDQVIDELESYLADNNAAAGAN